MNTLLKEEVKGGWRKWVLRIEGYLTARSLLKLALATLQMKKRSSERWLMTLTPNHSVLFSIISTDLQPLSVVLKWACDKCLVLPFC